MEFLVASYLSEVKGRTLKQEFGSGIEIDHSVETQEVVPGSGTMDRYQLDGRRGCSPALPQVHLP